MTQTCSETDLNDSVCEVLESMCFLDAECGIAPPDDDEARWVTRKLEFRGPCDGAFGLRATYPAAALIAANLLGQDAEELTEQQIGESIAELANMVCGSVLGRMEHKQAFDLTSPHVDHGAFYEHGAEEQISSNFALEEGVLSTWLQIKPRL